MPICNILYTSRLWRFPPLAETATNGAKLNPVAPRLLSVVAPRLLSVAPRLLIVAPRLLSVAPRLLSVAPIGWVVARLLSVAPIVLVGGGANSVVKGIFIAACPSLMLSHAC